MNDPRMQAALSAARQSAGAARGDVWAQGADLDLKAISGAVEAALSRARPPVKSQRHQLGYIVALVDRGGPAASYKLSNASREVSRTVYLTALFGLIEGTLAQAQPEPIRVLASLVALTYAAFQTTRATVGYSDAAVLHKAWQIAGGRTPRTVTEAELLACRAEIAAEYKAPKCASETEILDAIRNLRGLKAMVVDEDRLVLKEKVTFFEDGRIKA